MTNTYSTSYEWHQSQDSKHTHGKEQKNSLKTNSGEELTNGLNRKCSGEKLRVLVACEYSGTVRDAFTRAGHYAMSCDLLPTDVPGEHYQGDVLDVLDDGWDLMIAHPPCTHLAVSGAAWFHKKQKEQADALDFVRLLMNAPIPKICIENPVSIISTKITPASQTIQPWMFGHMEQKATCLWLKALPLLEPTHNVYDEMMLLPKSERERIHYLPPGPNRWKERSKTFTGIAEAMASQWSNIKQRELWQ